jgi:hypothetical protein
MVIFNLELNIVPEKRYPILKLVATMTLVMKHALGPEPVPVSVLGLGLETFI